MAVMPRAYEGPAQQHVNWALVTRLRAGHALAALPQDRTAPTRVPRARVAFGQAFAATGDELVAGLLLDQGWLLALRDELGGALAILGCEDARTTADTVRNIVRCVSTYLVEAELGQATGCLVFTYDIGQTYR